MSTDHPDDPDLKLRFPAGRFEEYLIDILIATQVSIGIAAVLACSFWFLAAPSSEGYWYPEILGLSVGMAVVAYLLKYLYGSE